MSVAFSGGRGVVHGTGVRWKSAFQISVGMPGGCVSVGVAGELADGMAAQAGKRTNKTTIEYLITFFMTDKL